MTADLEQAMRNAMRSATADVRVDPATTALVRARFRRGQRRRRAVVAAGVAVIAVTIPAAVLIGTGGTSTETQVLRVAPSASTTAAATTGSAAPTASPGSVPNAAPSGGGRDRSGGPSVDGVEVTWLPAGVTSTEPDPAVAPDPPIMPSPYTRGASVRRLSLSGSIGGRLGFVMIDVQRGPAPTLDQVQSMLRAAGQPQRTFARTTVRGHPALVTRLDAKREFSLVWAERDDLLLSLSGGDPVAEGDLREVAAGLRVHEAPAPADPATEQAIRTAVTRAFAAGATPADLAAAVENGTALAAVPGQIATRFPSLAATTRVSVHDVEIVGTTVATVVLTFSFDEPALVGGFVYTAPDAAAGRDLQHEDTTVQAIRTPDLGWQVTRASYCQIARRVGGRC